MLLPTLSSKTKLTYKGILECCLLVKKLVKAR